jgi:UDP-N-acetylglucosamine/UDP-N-acetylgalactosamine diphosphorylase
MRPSYEQLRHQAAEYGQQHLFRFWDSLDDQQRQQLLEDVAAIDFPCIAELVAPGQEPDFAPPVDRIEPAPVFPAEPDAEQRDLYRRARHTGEELLAASRVAAMIVAGGQGTRLGFDRPKGMFPITPVRDKTLFRLFAETILAIRRRYGATLPWYIMTSDATDAETREFFARHDYLGLGEESVTFFKQGVMPAVDGDGKILMADRHRVALSPNGHGGSLMALRRCGVLDDLKRRGIDVLTYFQVDNPLVSPADPLFIGLHHVRQSEMSSLAVPKADDLERVGNFVQVDGKVQVIEYSDLPEELARAKKRDGSRKLDSGSVAIHVLDPGFVSRLTSGSGPSLPWHRARKKVPYFDLRSERLVEPDQPNATKFEMFIFDAIPLAENAIVLQQPRATCFSPVKNPEGVDSPATARRDMVRRAASWLESSGVDMPRRADGEPAATIEISPLRALDAEQLGESLEKPLQIKPGDEVYLD